MDTTFDEDPFFTTLLQSGKQGRSTTVMASSHDNVGLQATLLEGEKRPPSKKTQRGVSFTVEEDNLLLSAWLNISMDAIRGTDKKYSQMWKRISNYYNEHKNTSMANRSGGSLTNRWSVIQKCTNKFCAAVAQVESLHPSGATEQDKIERAKIMYRETEKATYNMEHCWCLLRHQPKWQQHVSMLSTKRKPHGKRPAMAESTPLGDDTIDDNVEVIFERPPGKKAEKERERKRKAAESYDAEFVEALTCMTNDRAVFMSERRQATSKLDVDRAQLLVEKKRRNDTENRKIDIEIMKIDLAGMNGMQ
ncbi:glutathione S-transferase T3-like [Juglans regia]|uniref:Glutathione S-transferase T3-like n=2 Tax=Juglans regia TaxID=51240 RepID=A0A6P9F451_JUGRE|nr:glutathione S-transferase T3-like [Juglans regia]